jgi:hypothetical protein
MAHTVPKFCVDVGVRIRCKVIQGVLEKILMLPIAEVRTRLAKYNDKDLKTSCSHFQRVVVRLSKVKASSLPAREVNVLFLWVSKLRRLEHMRASKARQGENISASIFVWLLMA